MVQARCRRTCGDYQVKALCTREQKSCTQVKAAVLSRVHSSAYSVRISCSLPGGLGCLFWGLMSNFINYWSALQRVFKIGTPVLCGLLVIAGLGGVARAQALYGSIVGTATDQSGAVVPNAKVEVIDVATGQSRQDVSDASGRFTFQNLQ